MVHRLWAEENVCFCPASLKTVAIKERKQKSLHVQKCICPLFNLTQRQSVCHFDSSTVCLSFRRVCACTAWWGRTPNIFLMFFFLFNKYNLKKIINIKHTFRIYVSMITTVVSIGGMMNSKYFLFCVNRLKN